GADHRPRRRRRLNDKRRDLDRIQPPHHAAESAIAAEVANPDRLLPCRHQERVAAVGEEHRRIPGVVEILPRPDSRERRWLGGGPENRSLQLWACRILVVEGEIATARVVAQGRTNADVARWRLRCFLATHWQAMGVAEQERGGPIPNREVNQDPSRR